MSRFRADAGGQGRSLRAACTLGALLLGSGGCTRPNALRLQASGVPLVVQHPGLYPETLEYDAKRDKFLVGSFREGGVYAIDSAGRAARIVDDPRLCSVLGIVIDTRRNRLWLVNSDLGACARPSAAGPKQLAGVGVYDLSSGAPLLYADLASLLPGPHLLNGIALDAAGNAYITDSFSPAIYEVDAGGRPSLFLQSEQFRGEGINLNGVVVHPDGYLLVIKKSDGALFKVPLDEPARVSRVAIAERFVGGDGLVLAGKRDLLIVSNQVPNQAANSAYALSSDDAWASAALRAVEPLGASYPTTAVLRGDAFYVVQSQLNELIQAPPERKSELHAQATIRRIGSVAR
jgi:hypothetical protein